MPVYSVTNVFERNLDALYDPSIRFIVNEGGTSSSKTFSIIQLLINLSIHRTQPLLTSITSESVPHLRRGCMRDFRAIMGQDFNVNNWYASSHVYNYGQSQIEFFSADEPDKQRGARRDVLFMNEANNMPKTTFQELSIRTRKKIFIDHNPVEEYWAHELQGRPEVAWIHSTYLDAKNVLPAEIVTAIEAQRDRDPNWWHVYGEGKIGKIEGLVHPRFTQIESMPETTPGEINFYGIDFGYTNDPSVLVHNKIIGDKLFSDQIFYQTGLMNNQISALMESNKLRKEYDEIFGDCAEPKSIDEIHSYGWNIKPCLKGPDSILAGIQKLNQYEQHWTKRSIEAIKEQRNYRYIVDKNGKLTNKPIETWNHAMEARRQSVFTKCNEPGVPGFFFA
jgi:phage terminase large subunit